jgi:hypothetical protein
MTALTEERRFPVLVSTTSHFVVWVEGDDPKDAADRLGGDPEWYDAIENERPRDYDWEIRQPDDADWYQVYANPQGPVDYCAHCDRTSPADRPMWHNGDCPKAVAR